MDINTLGGYLYLNFLLIGINLALLLKTHRSIESIKSACKENDRKKKNEQADQPGP